MSSVRKNEREDHRFTVLDKALDLYDYTMTVIANENIFKPKYKSLINRIDNEATLIYHYCRSANEDFDARVKEEAEHRIELQEKAIEQCMWLKTDIKLAKRKYHLRAKRIVYWNNKINDVISYIKAWRESEKRRYKESHGL